MEKMDYAGYRVRGYKIEFSLAQDTLNNITNPTSLKHMKSAIIPSHLILYSAPS